MKKLNIAKLLELLDGKSKYSTMSKEESIGVQKAITWICKEVGLHKCPNCGRYLKNLKVHEFYHLYPYHVQVQEGLRKS